jgi:hypothetical protein
LPQLLSPPMAPFINHGSCIIAYLSVTQPCSWLELPRCFCCGADLYEWNVGVGHFMGQAPCHPSSCLPFCVLWWASLQFPSLVLNIVWSSGLLRPPMAHHQSAMKLELVASLLSLPVVMTAYWWPDPHSVCQGVLRPSW